MASYSNAIKSSGLVKNFDDVTAVSGLDLTVEQGEIFGLIGPDGAGKTTTMRILAGILKPDSGGAEVLGVDVVNDPEAVKEKVGYMSQRFGLYEDLTVKENIDFYADLYLVSKREKKERLVRLMEFSRLSPFLDRLAGKLSGGMKQKLGLACSLIHTPDLLLLDEPTNGVDPVSRREFWEILYELLKDGITIFISTPYMDEADRCHRVGIMESGGLLISDTPAGIREQIRLNIVEVRCEEAKAAREILKRVEVKVREGIKDVIFFGDKIHISVEDGGGDEKSIKKTLTNSGIVNVSARQIVPSLEDVFFELSNR
jgi:drug efflux transport system ATP-binding protein